MDDELPVVFDCDGEELLGVIHRGKPDAATGVVIVVGGPQYRVGSHRQFVLMARQLAAGGIPVLRFDYRGVGDASGDKRTFEEIDQDIHVAIDCLMANLPSIKKVSLLGLCDAASAIMMYGQQDERVTGMILMNPWIRTEVGFRSHRLRYYYLPRMMRRSFWRKVFAGDFSPIKSMGGVVRSLRATIPPQNSFLHIGENSGDRFVGQMLLGLESFKYPILLLLSGRDLGNREFSKLCNSDGRWKKAVHGSQIDTKELVDADHTLSARKDLVQAASQCLVWLRELYASDP